DVRRGAMRVPTLTLLELPLAEEHARVRVNRGTAKLAKTGRPPRLVPGEDRRLPFERLAQRTRSRLRIRHPFAACLDAQSLLEEKQVGLTGSKVLAGGVHVELPVAVDRHALDNRDRTRDRTDVVSEPREGHIRRDRTMTAVCHKPFVHGSERER